MKTLTLQIPDRVYECVESRAAARGATIGQEVVALLERVADEPEDAMLAAARARMAELFRTVKGFRQIPRMAREELYERGSFR